MRTLRQVEIKGHCQQVIEAAKNDFEPTKIMEEDRRRVAIDFVLDRVISDLTNNAGVGSPVDIPDDHWQWRQTQLTGPRGTVYPFPTVHVLYKFDATQVIVDGIRITPNVLRQYPGQ